MKVRARSALQDECVGALFSAIASAPRTREPLPPDVDWAGFYGGRNGGSGGRGGGRSFVGPVEARQLPGRGIGLVTSRQVRAGELLLLEDAWATSTTKGATSNVAIAELEEACVKKLGTAGEMERALFWCLHGTSQVPVLGEEGWQSPSLRLKIFEQHLHRLGQSDNAEAGYEEGPGPSLPAWPRQLQSAVSAIVASNSRRSEAWNALTLLLDETQALGGLWLVASLFNHSCCANVTLSYSLSEDGAARIYHVMDCRHALAPWHELVDTYALSLDLSEGETRRVAALRLQRTYGFLCTCTRCSVEAPLAAEAGKVADLLEAELQTFSALRGRRAKPSEVGEVVRKIRLVLDRVFATAQKLPPSTQPLWRAQFVWGLHGLAMAAQDAGFFQEAVDAFQTCIELAALIAPSSEYELKYHMMLVQCMARRTLSSPPSALPDDTPTSMKEADESRSSSQSDSQRCRPYVGQKKHTIATTAEEEIRMQMQALGFEADNTTIYQLISDLDGDGSQNLEFEEFLKILKDMQVHAVGYATSDLALAESFAELALLDSANEARTPVTVLSGALGAGKTTLLRYILEKDHGYRIAVIQNEFSDEMGMEAPLFTDSKGNTIKDVYELPNGCLCCSAKDSLVGTLDVLLEQKSSFDYILVEATGVADPESICEVFWVDEGLGSRVYLDGVVTLVDAYYVLSYLGKADEGPNGLGLETEALKQVACADVLVLNKIDLVPEEQLQRSRATMREINPAARILESRFAAVSLVDILGLRAFSRDRLEASLQALCTHEVEPSGHGHHGHSHSHEHSHGHSHGSDEAAPCSQCETEQPIGKLYGGHGIESVLLHGEAETLYDPDKVRSWLADVLWEGSAGFVYRCKGLFRGPSEEDAEASGTEVPVAHALQGVGKLFEIEEAPNASVPKSKLLFIGRGLKRDALSAGLKDCELLPADAAGYDINGDHVTWSWASSKSCSVIEGKGQLAFSCQDPGKCKVRLAGVRQDEQSCGCTEEAPSTSSTEAPEAPVEVESVTPLHAFLDLSESVEQDHQVHQPSLRDLKLQERSKHRLPEPRHCYGLWDNMQEVFDYLDDLEPQQRDKKIDVTNLQRIVQVLGDNISDAPIEKERPHRTASHRAPYKTLEAMAQEQGRGDEAMEVVGWDGGAEGQELDTEFQTGDCLEVEFEDDEAPDDDGGDDMGDEEVGVIPESEIYSDEEAGITTDDALVAFSTDGAYAATGNFAVSSESGFGTPEMDPWCSTWRDHRRKHVNAAQIPAQLLLATALRFLREEIEWILWHPKGHAILAGSNDTMAWMWWAPSGKVMQIFAGHAAGVTCGCWGLGGKVVVTGSEDHGVIVWNPRAGTPQHHIREVHESSIISICSHPESPIVVTGAEDATAKILQIETGKVLEPLPGHIDSVEAVAFSNAPPKSTLLLATGSMDGTVQVWDAKSMDLRCTIKDHFEKGGIVKLKWLPGSTFGNWQ
eukprot:s2412_g13.t1